MFERFLAPRDGSAAAGEPTSSKKIRVRDALKRTGRGLTDLLMGAKSVDEALLDELETLLITADAGIAVSEKIISQLTQSLKRRELGDAKMVWSALHAILLDILQQCERPLQLNSFNRPAVILVVGVNGVGKTTTIGKLAWRLKQEGKSVLLAAGDTFRAAAVEQLQVWGQSQDIPVIAQPSGADSASVIFDALQSARAKNVDVVIADTAGRLHNKLNLMEELAKVTRVAAKIDPTAPHEVLLVLDAATGQNGLAQLEEFKTHVGVTGMVLTKLDGTAKGGVIFALAEKHQVPVRFIGVGEGVEDLQTFVAKDFVDALLPPV